MKKTIELNKAKEIKELSDSLLSNDFISNESEVMKTIKQREEEIKLREENLNKKYDEAELKKNQIEEGIEDLAIIISDIKSAGLSFLKLEPKAEDCPFMQHSLFKRGFSRCNPKNSRIIHKFYCFDFFERRIRIFIKKN